MSPTGNQPQSRSPGFRLSAQYLLAWFAFLIAAITLGARFVPVVNHTILILAAASPFLMMGAGVSAVVSLLTRRWWAAGAALCLTAAATFVQLPLFIGSGQIPGPTVPVRVLTANLRLGAADPEALAALARERADLLVVQELTPELAGALSRQGVQSEFPYSSLPPGDNALGVGIWSRYPIRRYSLNPGYSLGMMSVSIRPPGAASDAVVLGVHITGPWPQPIDRWRKEMAKLPDTLSAAAAAAGSGAVIVAGDFNASNDMQPFRRLLRNGFRDAAEQSGAGLTPTFPADASVPPLIGIDHILTFHSSASDVRTVRIPGSDHLGLIATIHVPQ